MADPVKTAAKCSRPSFMSELTSDYFDKLNNKQHLVRYHLKRLQSLGFKVPIETLEKAA